MENNKEKEIENNIAYLKSILEQENLKAFSEIKSSIKFTIDELEKKLKCLKKEMTFQQLIGKYFCYDNSHPNDKEYVYVRNVTKNGNVICDKFGIQSYSDSSKSMHIYKNEEFSYFEIQDFTEISKEEFFEIYDKFCHKMFTK